jgi:hypothetical protein
MHGVLPVGAVRPRGGNALKVSFGNAIDCGVDWVTAIAKAVRSEARGPRLWSAIASELEEATRHLEALVNPAAKAEGDRS